MSDTEKTYLDRLKSLTARHANEELRTREDGTSFQFGKVCGIYQGLILAERLFEEVIGEEDDRT